MMQPEAIRFWAKLTFLDGKSRKLGWRPDLTYDDEQGQGWMIWPIVQDENGEFGFVCLNEELWQSHHQSRLVPGSGFFLNDGRVRVAEGEVTLVTP